MVATAVGTYGGLDVLHNNAAATHLAARQDLAVVEADPAVWDDTMRINLRGTMVAIQAAVPHLIARGGGSIINTSSGSGLAGDLRNPAYGASKAALDQPHAVRRHPVRQAGRPLQRHRAGVHRHAGRAPARRTGRSGRRCCAITSRRAWGGPEDVASAVVFLASDESAFITGHTLRVDGGLLSHAPYVADLRDA